MTNEKDDTITASIQHTLDLNIQHQRILQSRLDTLRSELQQVDTLLEEVQAIPEDILPDNEDYDEEKMVVVASGSFKPVGILNKAQLLQTNSPFVEDADILQRYLDRTTPLPWAEKEKHSIYKQVISQNRQLWVVKQLSEGHSDAPTACAVMPDSEFEDNLEGIDWYRLALTVSEETGTNRTAWSCKLRWVNDLRLPPSSKPWSAKEKEDLMSSISRYGDQATDWVNIAKALNIPRRPTDCIRQYITTISNGWSDIDDDHLLDAVARFGENNWNSVALAISKAYNSAQCSSRYQQLFNTASKGAPWTAEEDDLLCRAVAKCGTSSFAAVARLVGSRSNDQCRIRWQSHLNPALTRGEWAPEEDERLLQAVETLKKTDGTVRWKTVSMMLDGKRVDSACRTRYTALTRNLERSSSPGKVNVDQAML